MNETWTLTELVAEAAARLEALPAPKNGQVRAVPDERTIRYYGTIGLLDRPAAMRGRTALYSRRHLAQVVAIKRMQGAGKSLAEIQAIWPTLDDATLGRMSGVQLTTGKPKATRKEFWKREPDVLAVAAAPAVRRPAVMPAAAPGPAITIPLDGGVSVVVPLAESTAISLSAADVRALRAAAAPLVTELANRGLIGSVQDTLEEEP